MTTNPISITFQASTKLLSFTSILSMVPTDALASIESNSFLITPKENSISSLKFMRLPDGVVSRLQN